MHQASYDHCKIFVEDYLKQNANLRVADIGSCDVNGVYKPLFARDGWEYVGFDQSSGKNVDVVMAPETIAEHAGKFDVVISGQTLEHVRMPMFFVNTIAKLAKPNGLIWIIAPNTFHFHEFPIDCYRFWPDGMRSVLESCGLDVLHCRMVGIDTYGLARRPGDDCVRYQSIVSAVENLENILAAS